jgi:hypothetical protein
MSNKKGQELPAIAYLLAMVVGLLLFVAFLSQYLG